VFDLAWSEIALIGVVALLVIGPKELPGAIRSVAQMLGKARRMAGEFQGHVDEMVREAKLDEVKREIDQFKTNVQNEVYKATNVDDLKRDIVDPLKQTAADMQRPWDQPAAPAGTPASAEAAPEPPAPAPAAAPAPAPAMADAAPAPAMADAAPAASPEPPAPPVAPPPFFPPGASRGA
jgi:sec-independent protein translocase protein TatB